MASDSILNSEIARLGQSQDERSPPELDPAFAPLDGRTPADRLAEARRLAEHLRYYGFDPKREDGNWQGYFPENGGELLARDDGSVAPHLGLFGAFLEQLKPAGEALNALTGSHLDFQYRRVLGFESRPAQPEHAHLSLALKKAAAPNPAMLSAKPTCWLARTTSHGSICQKTTRRSHWMTCSAPSESYRW